MARYIYSLFLGLVGATVLHLAIVFLLPSLSANTNWRFIEANTEKLEPIELSGEDTESEQNFMLDPLFRHFVCRYDLRDGPAQLTAGGNAKFWSVAVFDSSGTIFFSANDRIANSDGIDIAVVNERQMRFVRQNTPDTVSESLVAAAGLDEGFIILRVFTPDSSWGPDVDDIFASIECAALDF